MCRTVHAVLSTAICGIQMLVRVFMTIILMIENVIRMVLQTLYNFISFLLQMLSLIPICIVFLLTSRLKCFMCGGGGPCPVNRGGACDCIMSALAIVILFFIFRATGVLDKMFYSIGYAKALPPAPARFVPTPGDITECSRNETDYDYGSTTVQLLEDLTYELSTDEAIDDTHYDYRVKLVSGPHQNLRNGTDQDKNSKDTDHDKKSSGTYHDKLKFTTADSQVYQQLTDEINYDPNG